MLMDLGAVSPQILLPHAYKLQSPLVFFIITSFPPSFSHTHLIYSLSVHKMVSSDPSKAKMDASTKLLTNDKPSPGFIPASQRVPMMARPFISERALKTLDMVEKFVEEECIPADPVMATMIGTDTATRFSAHPPILEDLKAKAKKLGLWNLFLPKNHFKEGAGFSNLEYGLMAEYLGKSLIASEACNCSAPDTGNMEVIAKYGTEEQKRKYLDPLLEGRWRSAFLMTEPDVASSDATNIGLTMKKEGNEWVLNGSVSCCYCRCFSGQTCELTFGCRNGGAVVQVTLAAKCTLSWLVCSPFKIYTSSLLTLEPRENQTQVTKTHTANSQS